MLNENRIHHIIMEELTKSEVLNIVNDKMSSQYKNDDFQRAVKKIVADVVEELYKTLWNRSSNWKNVISR